MKFLLLSANLNPIALQENFINVTTTIKIYQIELRNNRHFNLKVILIFNFLCNSFFDQSQVIHSTEIYAYAHVHLTLAFSRKY